MKLPDPILMFTDKSESGAIIEGRLNRKGYQSMKIGAYTRSWRLFDLKTSNIEVEGLPFNPVQFTYKIKLNTFLPFALFDDIKRYDSFSTWLTSYQEVKRDRKSVV